MSMIREALRGMIVLAASVVCVGVAAAQDGDPPPAPTPQEVVQHCLREMGDISHTTLDAIHAQTERGIGAIVDLAQNGAEPSEIVHTGMRAKDACTMAARRGQQALNDALTRCLNVLAEIDAPREASATLIEARRRAGLAIGDALTTCKRHINHTVARALGAGGPTDVTTAGAALTR